MLSMLKAMAKNLGKTGTLVEKASESSEPTSQKRDVGHPRKSKQEEAEEEDDPFADLNDLPQAEYYAAVRDRVDKMFDDERAAEAQKKAAANGAR